MSPATTFPGSFLVHGEVIGPNKCLMVNLALLAKAMEALIGNTESHLPQQLPVMIQSLKNIECHISPCDKHFANANVLGADFLVKHGLTLKANYASDIFTLMVEGNE